VPREPRVKLPGAKGRFQMPPSVSPTISKPGNRRFYSGKNGQLRCIATGQLKSQCVHCNSLHYTGKDGHKYCRATNRRKVICNCDSCNKAGVNHGLCEHHRQKYKCKDCNGASLCAHGRQRSKCKECFKAGEKVAGICKHGKEKYRCTKCTRKR